MTATKTVLGMLLIVVVAGLCTYYGAHALWDYDPIPAEEHYATVQGTIAGYGAQESVIYATGVPREFEKLLIPKEYYNHIVEGTHFGDVARFGLRMTSDGWTIVGIRTDTKDAGYFGWEDE